MPALSNAKHERFAQNLISGMSQRQAYLDAFPSAAKWTPETVDSKACNLAKDDKVLARLDELKAASASAAILSRQERMEFLSNVILDEHQLMKFRLQATDLLNKMDGDYVKKTELTVTTPVSETAAQIAAILDEVDDGP